MFKPTYEKIKFNRLRLNNINSFIQLVICKVLLSNLYVTFIVPIFGYEGYVRESSSTNILFGWIITLLLISISHTNQLIKSFFKILIVVYAFPAIILYENNTNYPLTNLLVLLMPLLALWRLRYFKVQIPEKLEVNFKSNLWKWFFFILGLFIILRVGSISNWKKELNFSEIYLLRENIGELQNFGLFGYLNNWVSKILIPLGVLYYYSKKMYGTTILILFFSFLFFNYTGHKATIFLPFSALVLYKILVFKNRWLLYFNLIISSILVMGQNVLSLVVVSFLIRRILFLPAFTGYNYLEFFENNKLLYSHTFLKNIIKYQYNNPPQLIIGDYMNLGGSWLNVGFASTGYMNLGIIGVILYTLVLRLIFSIVIGANPENKNIITLLCLSTVSVFTSSDLFTAILTNGIILLIIYALFYETESWSSYNKT